MSLFFVLGTGLNSLAQWCSSRHSLRSALCYAKLPPKAFAVAKLLCSNPYVFSSSSRTKKDNLSVVSFFCTRDGTRTRTAVKPADFKSAMSTIPSPEQKGFLIIVSCNFTIALNDLSFLFFHSIEKINRKSKPFFTNRIYLFS